jgi:predicted hotdog family 3-hydroxylacyl-ACP dehydratase
MAKSKPLICESCKDKRLNAGERPRTLVQLPITTEGGEVVYACEWCDGPAIERSVRASLKARDE